jgi:hypothetical protein
LPGAQRQAPDGELLPPMPRKIRGKLTPECRAVILEIHKAAGEEGREAEVGEWKALKPLMKGCGCSDSDVYEVLLALGLVTAPPPKEQMHYTGKNAWKNKESWMRTDWYRAYQRLASKADEKKRAAAAGGE